MAFKCDVKEKDPGTYIVKMEGHLDADAYLSLEGKVRPIYEQPAKTLILDMSGLEYVNSSGLGVIFQAKRIIEASGGNFVMLDLQPQVKRIFEIVKALPQKAVFKDMEEVDRYLDAIQRKELEKRKDEF